MPHRTGASLIHTGLVVGLVATGAAAGHAQTTIPESGDTTRIRAGQRAAAWQYGIVVSADEESVRLIQAGTADTVAYAVRREDEWQVARGIRSNAVRGVIIGAGIGGVLGGAIAAAVADGIAGSYRVEEVALGVGIGGAIGAGVGAVIGAISRTRRWEPVVRPGPRLDAGVSVAF